MQERSRASQARILGDVEGERPGPLLILTGGIHGNEPDGVAAIERVFARLAELELPVRGRVVGLAGNLGALAEDRRFLDEDLNRVWVQDQVDSTDASDLSREGHERRELHDLFQGLFGESWDQVTLLDLHSTSGVGPPFAILSDRRDHLWLANAIRVPAVLGLHDNVPGTLIDWFEGLGHRAIVVEGGQAHHELTCDRLESVAWLALGATGVIPADTVDVERHHRRLDEATEHLPKELEVALRWGIEEGETFLMEEGFENLEKVQRGQLLARTGPRGDIPVLSPFDGLLIMPKYQEQGLDGFFLAPAPHVARRVDSRPA